MKLIIIFSAFLLSSPAFSEIYNCNGVWTDKPCNKLSDKPTPPPTASAPESTPSSSQDRDETFAERRKLFTDADLEAFRARRDGKGNIPLDEARDVCLAPKGDLSLCRKLVYAILEKIQLLQPKPTAAQINNNEKSNNNTQVVIVNENNNYELKKRHNPNKDPRKRPVEKSTPTLIPLIPEKKDKNSIAHGGGMPPLMNPQ